MKMTGSGEDRRIREIEREIVRYGMIDTPGTILLGLGLYGRFAATEASDFLPQLASPTWHLPLILVGGLLCLACMSKVVLLAREKRKLIERAGRGIRRL